MQPFTLHEQAAINAVLQHQHQFSRPATGLSSTPLPTEMHIALDGAGVSLVDVVVHPATGGDMSASMVAAANSAKGCRIFHNHPSEHSLSAADWTVLANFPGMEITAVNSEGTTFRGKVLMASAISNWKTDIQVASAQISNSVSQKVSQWTNLGDWNFVDQATEEWAIGWAIGDCLASKGYAEYECIPAGRERGIIQPAFMQELMSIASLAIP